MFQIVAVLHERGRQCNQMLAFKAAQCTTYHTDATHLKHTKKLMVCLGGPEKRFEVRRASFFKPHVRHLSLRDVSRQRRRRLDGNNEFVHHHIWIDGIYTGYRICAP